MERECLDCGSQLRGRADKKFCDDQCRSNYNNRIRAENFSSLSPVNAILKKNYSILARVCREGKTRLKKDKLLRSGFNLNYHTHLCQTQRGNTYFFCYEYGYLNLDNEIILVVKKEEL